MDEHIKVKSSDSTRKILFFFNSNSPLKRAYLAAVEAGRRSQLQNLSNSIDRFLNTTAAEFLPEITRNKRKALLVQLLDLGALTISKRSSNGATFFEVNREHPLSALADVADFTESELPPDAA